MEDASAKRIPALKLSCCCYFVGLHCCLVELLLRRAAASASTNCRSRVAVAASLPTCCFIVDLPLSRDASLAHLSTLRYHPRPTSHGSYYSVIGVEGWS